MGVDVEVQRLHGTGVCSLPAGLDRSQGRPDLDEAAAGAGAMAFVVGVWAAGQGPRLGW